MDVRYSTTPARITTNHNRRSYLRTFPLIFDKMIHIKMCRMDGALLVEAKRYSKLIRHRTLKYGRHQGHKTSRVSEIHVDS